MLKHIRFGLDSGNMECCFDMPARVRSRMRYTRHNLKSRNIEIWIATEALQPLLNEDLTEAEVLVSEPVALTLCH